MRVLQTTLPYDYVMRSPDALQSLAVMGGVASLLNPLIDDGGLKGRAASRVTGSDYGNEAGGFAITAMAPYGTDNKAAKGLLLTAKDATTLLKGLKHLAKTEGDSKDYQVVCMNRSGLAMYAGRWGDGASSNLALGALSIVGHNAKQAAIRIFLGTLGKVHEAVSRDSIGYILRHGKLNEFGIKLGLDHYASWSTLAQYLGRDNRLMGKCAVLYICPSHAMPPSRQFSGGTVEAQMQSHLSLNEIVSKASVLFHK